MTKKRKPPNRKPIPPPKIKAEDVKPGSPSLDEMYPRMTAALDMVGRTGANSVQIRWSDDEMPFIYFCVAEYVRDDVKHYKIGSAFDPERAALKLLEDAIDDAMCTWCHRPCGFEPDLIEVMPLDKHFCWYQFDPELKKFRRGCEGDNE